VLRCLTITSAYFFFECNSEKHNNIWWRYEQSLQLIRYHFSPPCRPVRWRLQPTLLQVAAVGLLRWAGNLISLVYSLSRGLQQTVPKVYYLRWDCAGAFWYTVYNYETYESCYYWLFCFVVHVELRVSGKTPRVRLKKLKLTRSIIVLSF